MGTVTGTKGCHYCCVSETGGTKRDPAFAATVAAYLKLSPKIRHISLASTHAMCVDGCVYDVKWWFAVSSY